MDQHFQHIQIFNHQLIDNSEITIDPCEDSTALTAYHSELVLKNRYYHNITKAEVDSTADIRITLPEQITDPKYLIVTVHLEVGWILELYIYQDV